MRRQAGRLGRGSASRTSWELFPSWDHPARPLLRLVPRPELGSTWLKKRGSRKLLVYSRPRLVSRLVLCLVLKIGLSSWRCGALASSSH